MTDRLKPCPFCGGEAEKLAKEVRGTRILMVVCRKCGASSGFFETKKPRVKDEENPTIKAWNTRKPMDRIVERLEAEKYRGMEGLEPIRVAFTFGINKAIEIVKEGGKNDR